MNVLVEMLHQGALRVIHARLDAGIHFIAQKLERGGDFVRGAAGLINRKHALFKIHAGFNRA